MTRWIAKGLFAAWCLLAAAPAPGQTVPAAPRPHTFEITTGVTWFGSVTMGSGSADLTKNQTPPTPYPLFTTSSSLASTTGFDGRLAFFLTHALAVEGTFTYARPRLETEVSGDVEGAPAVTASETLRQYTVEASVVLHLTRWRLGSHTLPFVYGGGGYLRQAHEREVLIASGHTFHVGGGVKYFVVRRSRGLLKNVGVRVDGRVSFRSGGVDLDASKPVHVLPILTAGVFVGF